MEFFRQEDWSGLPFRPLGDLPSPGTEPASLVSPVSAGGFFQIEARKGHLDLLFFLLLLLQGQSRAREREVISVCCCRKPGTCVSYSSHQPCHGVGPACFPVLLSQDSGAEKWPNCCWREGGFNLDTPLLSGHCMPGTVGGTEEAELGRVGSVGIWLQMGWRLGVDWGTSSIPHSATNTHILEALGWFCGCHVRISSDGVKDERVLFSEAQSG